MDLFKDLEIQNVEPEDKLSDGFSTLLMGGVYDAIIKFVKIKKNNLPDNKSIIATVVYTVNGNEYVDYFTIVNSQGKNTNSFNGKPLVGWNKFASMLYLIDGSDPYKGLNIVKKKLREYNFATKSDEDVEAAVLSNVIDKPIKVGVIYIKQNKNVQNDEGQWVPTNDLKEKNQIDHFFDPKTGQTHTEKLKQIAPEFIYKWKEKNEGKVTDRFKPVDTTPVSEEKTDPTEKSTPWF